MDLHKMIREGHLRFYAKSGEVGLADFFADSFNAKAYEKYPTIFLIELAEHLSLQPQEYLSIRGSSLEEFLEEADHVDDMVEFIVEIYSKASERDQKVHICIAADIYRINFEDIDYKEQDSTEGTNISTWGKGMLPFEKYWNVSICDFLNRHLETYPPPTTPEEFEEAAAEIAGTYLVGTPQQLKRYHALSEKYPSYRKGIEKAINGFILDAPN